MSGTGDNSTWAQLIAALVSGSALPWLFRYVRRIVTGESVAQSDVLEAAARKTNAETDGLLADRLWAEIERLDRALNTMRDELEAVKAAAASEKTQLETDNTRLRGEVRRLTARVSELEAERDRKGAAK